MIDLSDVELQRRFTRRKRLNAYGYGLTFLVILLSFIIAWVSGANGTPFTEMAFSISLPFVLVFLIVKGLYWRCPACGASFSWSRSKLREYYGSGAVTCAGCKRALSP
jgi:hypothetical protein